MAVVLTVNDLILLNLGGTLHLQKDQGNKAMTVSLSPADLATLSEGGSITLQGAVVPKQETKKMSFNV
jgi:hypothetical protein